MLDYDIEKLTRSELENLQSERLRNLVSYVYDNCKMYKSKMQKEKVKPKDIKSIKDIHKLPFTTKQDLRSNYPFGMFSAKKKDIIRLHASSGTSGKLTVVGYTKNDIEMWSTALERCLRRVGVNENSVCHIAFGYGLFTGGIGIHYGCEKVGAVTVPVSTGNTERQLMLLKDFQADVLFATPSYAIYLSESMKKYGYKIDDFNLKIGIFGAEPWSDHMRSEIEKRLKIKAYDIYGLSEIAGPGVACECKKQQGLHISEDLFYPEIVDVEKGQQLGYNKEGEMVMTTLLKEGIPLIRYRTRDLTSLHLDECACNETLLVRMKRVKARNDDMMIIRGVNVFPSQIETVLYANRKDISPNYRLIITRKGALDDLEIQVELSENFQSDEIKKVQELQRKLRSEIASMIGINAQITLLSFNSLPRTAGKTQRIIDQRIK